MSDFNELVGKTLTAISGGVGDEEIRFTCDDGSAYRQYHYQDCCETVEVNEIHGELSDLINDGPVLFAEESGGESEDTQYGSQTWTFYKLRTLHGDVTIRWLGESNGYYSESVYFERVEQANAGISSE